MNLGQSLYAIGAMLILSLIVLRMNNSILTTDEVVLDSKLGVLATSVGTSLIEEASKLPFDENTKVNPVVNTSSLTTAPFVREVAGVFDDFDDYNNFTDSTIIYSIPFYSRCTVTYITDTNPNGSTNTKSWHKKLTIRIVTPFSPGDTINLSTIYSYWKFR
jgi:MSHA pilin protein MshD